MKLFLFFVKKKRNWSQEHVLNKLTIKNPFNLVTIFRKNYVDILVGEQYMNKILLNIIMSILLIRKNMVNKYDFSKKICNLSWKNILFLFLLLSLIVSVHHNPCSVINKRARGLAVHKQTTQDYRTIMHFVLTINTTKWVGLKRKVFKNTPVFYSQAEKKQSWSTSDRCVQADADVSNTVLTILQGPWSLLSLEPCRSPLGAPLLHACTNTPGTRGSREGEEHGETLRIKIARHLKGEPRGG